MEQMFVGHVNPKAGQHTDLRMQESLRIRTDKAKKLYKCEVIQRHPVMLIGNAEKTYRYNALTMRYEELSSSAWLAGSGGTNRPDKGLNYDVVIL